MKPEDEPPKPRRSDILWIMAGLLAWGVFLAVGAIRVGGNHALWRGAIVFACTLAFLGLWWAAMFVRQRQVEAQANADDESAQT